LQFGFGIDVYRRKAPRQLDRDRAVPADDSGLTEKLRGRGDGKEPKKSANGRPVYVHVWVNRLKASGNFKHMLTNALGGSAYFT
jgi:hypothetical protein